jgi:hypothetical protein
MSIDTKAAMDRAARALGGISTAPELRDALRDLLDAAEVLNCAPEQDPEPATRAERAFAITGDHCWEDVTHPARWLLIQRNARSGESWVEDFTSACDMLGYAVSELDEGWWPVDAYDLDTGERYRIEQVCEPRFTLRLTGDRPY